MVCFFHDQGMVYGILFLDMLPGWSAKSHSSKKSIAPSARTLKELSPFFASIHQPMGVEQLDSSWQVVGRSIHQSSSLSCGLSVLFVFFTQIDIGRLIR